MRSSLFSVAVCCSDTSATQNGIHTFSISTQRLLDICGGDAPLSSPNPCSASSPCPVGYNCRNGRCCPAKGCPYILNFTYSFQGMCPTGQPLGGRVTSCSSTNPCPNNYQCVNNNGAQYCCPAPGWFNSRSSTFKENYRARVRATKRRRKTL